jgi:glycosyltransferase involved in cell wall biosynthesis
MEAISVIMPAFNAEKTLYRAVLSTLSALTEFDELLIIEDGSGDGTGRVAKSFTDGRVRILTNSGNLGLSRSLNLGLVAAKNRIIARMDSDDVCLPWRFSVQRKLFDRKRPDFLFGSQVLLAKTFPILIPHTYVTRSSPGSLERALGLACVLAHPTMMSTKSTLMALGQYRDVVAEDYDLWLRAVLDGKSILRHWMPVNLYRMGSQSLSKKDAKGEGHLSHLTKNRISILGSREENITDPNIGITKYRRNLSFKDPLLYLETGIFTSPLRTLI